MKPIFVVSLALCALASAQKPPVMPQPSQPGPVLHPEMTMPPLIPPIIPPIIPPVIPPETTKAAVPLTTTSKAPTTTSTSNAPPAIVPPAVSVVPLPPLTTARPISSTTSSPMTTQAAVPVTGTTAIYNNPFCPPDPGYSSTVGYQGCSSSTAPNNVAHDVQGDLVCDNYSCCLCQSVNCGLNGNACGLAYFGDSAVVGVQNIRVQGSLTPIFVPGSGMVSGARVECSGLEACKNAFITADTVHDMECGGELSCQQATIIIENPTRGMTVDCTNMYSCMDAYIEINIGETPTTPCNPQQMPDILELGISLIFIGENAAHGATIVINNRGCDIVDFEGIECPTGSCLGAEFRIHGSVQIQSCDIGAEAAMVPRQCGGGGGAVFNPPSQPLPPAPRAPTTPIIVPNTNPNPNVNPSTTSAPIVPAPPVNPVTNIQTPGMQQASNIAMMCGDWDTCAYQQYQVINPQPNWELECIAPGSCNSMQINIDFAPGFQGDRIEGFVFSAADASQGAIVRVNTAYYLEISHLQCKEAGSCAGLLLEVGAGVDVYSMGVECNIGACSGCYVKQGSTIVACDTLAAQQGQHYQFLPQAPI